MLRQKLLATALCFAASSAALAATPDLEKQVNDLKTQVDALEQKLQSQDGAPSAGKNHFGGYGELHYNHLDSGNVLDLHRVVFYFGHDFNDWVRFNSELEIEHAFVENEGGSSAGGEVALEQAYLEFDVARNLKVRGGLLLQPLGILNETHEPPTFYGVERNPVERFIIPSTWRDGGAMLSGAVGNSGFGYDLAMMGGMKVPTEAPGVGEDDERFEVFEGKQEGAEGVANDFAYTARLRYVGIPGFSWALAAQYQSDITQGEGPAGTGNAQATLLETHAIYEHGPFGVRALYARWDIRNDVAEALKRDVQDGYYFEGSYKPLSQLGVFARYAVWDNGGPVDQTEKTQTNIGVNYWPIENVVLKADLQYQGKAASDDGFNLGIGYRF